MAEDEITPLPMSSLESEAAPATRPTSRRQRLVYPLPPVAPPPPLIPPSPFDLGPTYRYRPFLSEQLLDDESPPPTAWADFVRPLHRQFAGHDRPITWGHYVGHGLDGIVYKASIDDKVFAVKVVCLTPRSFSFFLPCHEPGLTCLCVRS